MNRKAGLFTTIIVLIILGTIVLNNTRENPVPEITEKQIIESDSFEFEEVSLNWIVIGGFKLKKGETVVYIDPKDVNRKEYDILEPADYIIITHDHTPHYSPLDMYYLSDDDTVWITSSSIRNTRDNQITAYPGDTLEYDDVIFEFVPAYNVDKTRPTGELFHPPELQNLGVIVDFDGTRIYHTGDSDAIPEMEHIETDIVLLPVSGYAWMTAMDAVEAVELLKMSSNLAYAIPIHYGYNQGTDTNALVFSSQVNCSVVILPRLFEK